MEKRFEDSEKLGLPKNSVGPLECQFCFINFYTHSGLKIHLKICHDSTLDMATLHNQQQKEGNSEKVHAYESFDKDNLTDGRVKIEDIKKKDPNEYGSSINTETQKPFSDKLEEVNDSPPKINKISESMKIEAAVDHKYKCNVCLRDFRRSNNLSRHIKVVHEKKKDFKCDVCNKEFGTKDKFKMHALLQHNSLKKSQCGSCNRNFKSKHFLDRHIKVVHESQIYKIFKQNFVNRSQSKKRKSAHPNVKEFQCLTCKKKFARNCELKVHVNGVHEKLNNFPCKKCNKTFSYYSGMSKHFTLNHK